jgi:hypothetical protein
VTGYGTEIRSAFGANADLECGLPASGRSRMTQTGLRSRPTAMPIVGLIRSGSLVNLRQKQP